MREVTAYQCDFCGKVLKYKCSAVRHAKNCKHNPTVRACTTCPHHGHETRSLGGWNEPPDEYVVPVCNSQKAADDEEHYFDTQENPFYIMRHCKHWEQKDGTATD